MLIDARVIAYLADRLEGVTVAAEVPDDFPEDARLIVVSRAGAQEENRLQYATLAVQSYGKTLLAAAQLNEAAVRALRTLAEDDPAVASCRVETSYNFSDTTQKRYRYQAVARVVYYQED